MEIYQNWNFWYRNIPKVGFLVWQYTKFGNFGMAVYQNWDFLVWKYTKFVIFGMNAWPI
jgi:hypothetical protein